MRCRRARLTSAFSLLVLSALGGCRDVLQTLGTTGGPSARARADELFSALALRVTDPYRNLKYDSARVRIASAAVVPSRIWRDTSVWTAMTDSVRQLLARGHMAGARYAMEAAPFVPPPTRLAEARHFIQLTRLSGDEYRWDTHVPFAVGSVTAGEVGAMFAAIFSSAEGRSDDEIRRDYQGVMPRTTSVAGRLFRVDSIRPVHLPDRSTLAMFAISVTPEGVEERYAAWAKYLRRYVHTARIRWTLIDSSGAPYWEMNMSGGQLTMRVRTAGGRMLALQGPPRLMPDSLTLTADIAVKVSRFTVGVRNYRGDFRIIADEHDRAWELVSRREPEWVLPLFTRTLLRTPLRRPFQGEGAMFRIGVRDAPGAQTLLYRTLRLEVQESAILRFVARLGAIAMSDYSGDVEREEMAWLRELFTAMIEDIRGTPGP